MTPVFDMIRTSLKDKFNLYGFILGENQKMKEVQKWVTKFSLINGIYIFGHFLLFVSMVNVQSIIGSINNWDINNFGINIWFAFLYPSFLFSLLPGFISEIRYWKANGSIKGKKYWTGWLKSPFYLITAYSRSWAYKFNLAFTAFATVWTSFTTSVGIDEVYTAGFLHAITFGHPYIVFWLLLILQPKFTNYCKKSFANELADLIIQLKETKSSDDFADKFYELFDFNVDYTAYLINDCYVNGEHIPKLHAFGIDSSITFKPVPLGLLVGRDYHFGTDRDYGGLMYNYHKGEIWTKDGTYEDYRPYIE